MSRSLNLSEFVKHDATRVLKPSQAAFNMAIALVSYVWWPTKEPFLYDPDALYERLKNTAGGLSVKRFIDLREETSKLFEILPDGRWEPSREYFRVSEDNEGGHRPSGEGASR